MKYYDYIVALTMFISLAYFYNYNVKTSNDIKIKVIKKPPSISYDNIDNMEIYDDMIDHKYYSDTIEIDTLEIKDNMLWDYILTNQKCKLNEKYLTDKNFRSLLSNSIDFASDYWKVPKLLIYSVIYIESSFYPYSISHKKCYGLMQINYNVWKDSLKIKKDWELYDIFNNIFLGTRLLKHYYEKGKTWDKALYYYFGNSKYGITYKKKVITVYNEYKEYLSKKIKGDITS